MAVNRYAAKCDLCGAYVPAMGGNLDKKDGRWIVSHLACLDSGKPEVIEYYFAATGNRATINRRGRCEDAPCCGCCSA